MTTKPDTKVLTGREPLLAALRELAAWADEIDFAYAWASSGGGKAAHWRAVPHGKLRRVIVGVHFAQTEPHALRVLAGYPGVLKVVEDTAGVFHPKVMVGVRGTEARAIVGSSNFTEGGFSGNTELNLLLHGSSSEGPLADILRFIELQWSGPRSFTPDAAWFDRYELAYAERPTPPRLPRPRGEEEIVRDIADLDVAWRRYYELIAAQERRTLANGAEIHVFDHVEDSYLEEAERCRAAFARESSFAAMPLDDRKLVSGWGDSAGYFGRMSAAGDFMQRVRMEPESIGTFLDLIPLEGPIPREVAQRCIDGLLSLHRVGIGAATRLLCIKRPDLFIPINNANEHRVRAVFGSFPRSARTYLDLHERIWSLEWVNAPRPADVTEQRVWAARVALLDALLYEAPHELSPPPGRVEGGS